MQPNERKPAPPRRVSDEAAADQVDEPAVHYAQFLTDSPLDHLPRALDELRRAGFGLGRIIASPEAAATTVRIEFFPEGTVPPATYLARIARMPGIEALEGGPNPSCKGTSNR